MQPACWWSMWGSTAWMVYGLAVAADCTVCYLLAPALGNPWVPLAIGAALVTGQVFLLNRVSRRRAGEAAV